MKTCICILLSLFLSQCKAQHSDMLIIYFTGISDKPILPIIVCAEKVDTAFIYKEVKDGLIAKHAIFETTIAVDTSIFVIVDKFIQNYSFDAKTDSLDWGNFHVFQYHSQKKITEYLLRSSSSSKKFFSLLIDELKKRSDCPKLLLFYLENNLARLN